MQHVERCLVGKTDIAVAARPATEIHKQQQHRDTGQRPRCPATFGDPLDNTADEQWWNQTGAGKEQAEGHRQHHFLSAATEQLQQANEKIHGTPCLNRTA